MQLNNFELYHVNMVIRFGPKNNQKVVEEQAVWRDHKLF